MMPEYLEKEVFKSWLKKNITNNPMILESIDYAPAADVAPIVHAHWDDSFDGITLYCSACGMPHRCLMRIPDYCPDCGAKMDEENSK